MAELKFFADDMVGRLCWWLRMMGYDIEYQRQIEDEDLAERIRKEDRILLTRDTTFADRYPDTRVFCLSTERAEVQVWMVLREFGLAFDYAWFSRCLVCNTELITVHKEQFRRRIPPYVFRTLDEFWYCKTCDQLFWRGTHHENMMRKLTHLRKEMEKLDLIHKNERT